MTPRVGFLRLSLGMFIILSFSGSLLTTSRNKKPTHRGGKNSPTVEETVTTEKAKLGKVLSM